MLPSRRHYAAIFTISLCLLVLELAYARMLSVALQSHFAFVAISLAMFGIGLAGLLVYLLPGHFTAAAADEQLVAYCWRFGIAAAVSDLAFLHLHVVQQLSLTGFLTLSLAYLLLALPFLLGGICVSLLMTHFARRIGSLYGADLVGASLGCLVAVLALTTVPAPLVPLLVAVAACATSLAFGHAAGVRARLMPAVATALVLVILTLALGTGLFRMRYVKNWKDFYAEWEGWNSFSRITVFPMGLDGNAAQTLPLKGSMDSYKGANVPQAKWIDIDGTAWTPMFRFDGDFSKIDFLRESVIYAVHNVRPDAKVLIVGTGGGRDILAARVFGQPEVLGIEINPLMERIVQQQFRAYSGGPYELPGVRVLIGEGRSTLAQLPDTFDVIQLSLVDTFAAGAAGGFVFTENYLYTRDAFQEYFRHLTPQGVLSVTRYFTGDYPLEMLRLLQVARSAWQAEGVEDFARHLVVLKQSWLATLLVKRTPFTDEEMARLERVAAENGMELIANPRRPLPARDDVKLLLGDRAAAFRAESYDVAATTDDRPFFFHFLRRRVADVGNDPLGFMRNWNDALVVMYLLIASVSALAVFFFVGPLVLLGTRSRQPPGAVVPMLLYFLCLGYGFMMIEIPVMQRLVLLLGYPVYALAVGLFSLLLLCGLGSLASARLVKRPHRAVLVIAGTIAILSVAYAFLLPSAIAGLVAQGLGVKVVSTVALLAPLGLVLGMAYPAGITLLSEVDEGLVPWAWGLNGAASVVASVLAVFLGSRVGFTAALLTGSAAYALAFLAVALAARAPVRAAEARVPRAAVG